LCGQCKKEASVHIMEFLKDLDERRDSTEHLVDAFVMDD
jgi:tryptophanyl-tRNA synthetase